MPAEPAGGDRPRYETLFKLAAGGMATVYVGTARGAFGFRQIVAIKKPHAHLLADPEFKKSLLREARLASLIHHANVVDVRDVEANDDDVSLVMDYVEGATLSELIQVQSSGGAAIPAGVAVRIILDACAGLHAAHEQTDERGRPLRLVHRDISPHNLLVGVDGLTRVADFGVAKFKRTEGATTIAGVLKGKLAYMAPEYVKGEGIDRRLDVFAMGVVLWEALTCERLFRGAHEADTLEKLLSREIPSVSKFVPTLGTAFDAIVATALARAPDQRFDNASAMAAALESSARTAGLLVGQREVAELVKSAVGPKLEERRALIRGRLANEPSVASVQYDPEGGVPPHESVPATTTVPQLAPPVLEIRVEAPTRAAKRRPVVPLGGTLRSEPAADKSAPPESILLPMKSGGVWRQVVAFIVITVAVAGGVVGVARLRGTPKAATSAAPSAVPPDPVVGRAPPAPPASPVASASSSASPPNVGHRPPSPTPPGSAPRHKTQDAPSATPAAPAPTATDSAGY
jgi:eukaryotic-like serine/threonine-protein kinase